ncbi:class I SAM-dependent methyltransferase [Sandarakinorhabdus sp.]|uniref:class I SAM-dependent methyltransferase n=1 Tax=Sandarakinorhabdus sp. TaxID=1916663 RepID=UPI00286DD713|nr:class I SAM-dependent methyltransferase [Sandarakinorhabdus sp.]
MSVSAAIALPGAPITASSALSRLLDRASAGFTGQASGGFAGQADIGQILVTLDSGLFQLRQQMDAAAWADACRFAQSHQIMHWLRQDPFVARCIARPRGYAGDAVIIDMLYHHADISHQVIAATPTGRQVHMVMSHVPVAQAVRDRRQVIVDLIDGTAQRHSQPHVLSIACGHLREAEMCNALASGRIGRFVALDQDAESLDVVRRRHGQQVEIIAEPISTIVKDRFPTDRYDLIYAAGLYDYLDARLAAALTTRLAARLNPGGRFVFANFSRDLWEAGFMEALLDWKLVLRSEADMQAIACAPGPGFSGRVWAGSNGDMLYGEVVRLG